MALSRGVIARVGGRRPARLWQVRAASRQYATAPQTKNQDDGSGNSDRPAVGSASEPRSTASKKTTQLPIPKIKHIIDPSYDPYAPVRQQAAGAVPDANKSLAELSGVSLWKAKLVLKFMELFRMDIEENQAAPVAGRNYMQLCKAQGYHHPEAKEYGSSAKFYYEHLGLTPSLSQSFQISALHIWMLLVRMRALPEKYANAYEQALVDGVFLDLEKRMVNEYKIRSNRLINNTLKEFNLQLRGSVLAYDEGLMADDTVLGAAIWRNIFGGRKDVNMAKVAILVQYVRTHIYVLDKMSDFDFGVGRFVFFPPWIEHNPDTVLRYQPPPLPSTYIFPGYESKFRRDN
ncbi:ubiquinol-cytochrome C chaperone-domain-containing protein [Lipomyces tetrasporus]|uniref:Ubiquinol-cytochrome C chaperone-domain-containing protein n=1 Tax=Lipomyces tetrasporus TaxID=54092 RepID=A0AAD7QXL2_9ASCO|nr:ubiquinol-cytochrome C chaperone-domain-containing protein [Lipomyces tetrasporus]KAJ8103229.1 ubiquinol-cytochrome C chaperone-domain-containing protein [Lipomyces tetrasporus]